MRLCVRKVKEGLTPEAISRLAGNEMPVCFGVTRELVVALAQKVMEKPA